MNKFTITAFVLFVVVAASIRMIPRAGAQQGPRAAGWEYAVLRLGDTDLWDDSAKHFAENNPDAEAKLARDFGGAQINPNYGTQIQLYNLVGELGWEVIQVDGSTTYFRRQR